MREQPTTPMETLSLGQTIDRRYLVREPLGEGGFAEVFEAVDTKLGRKVALKILKPHKNSADAPLAHRRFFREAKLAAQITHPSIVTIFDYGQLEDARPYIVLEYLEGKPLSRELWHSGPMLPRRAYDLFLHAVHAIAAAHERGVIHRDLKPSNLMIVFEGTRHEMLKVLDFGIAFYFEEAMTRLTSTGQFIGTPEYLSPEYIGERAITPALDVYQLALIFIEMLTGQPLISFPEPMQCMFAHFNGLAKVPAYLADSDVGQVLARALAHNHTHRFHNAGAFFKALEAIDPATIPALPAQATPEELSITRDWSNSEVEQFSQLIDAHIAQLPNREDTASFDPEQPGYVMPSPSAPTQGAEGSTSGRASRRTALLVGGLAALIVGAAGMVALLLDVNHAPSPPEPASQATPSIAPVTAPEAIEAPRRIHLSVTPMQAEFFEGEERLGAGEVTLLLSRDTPELRRVRVQAPGYLPLTEELSRDSPEELTLNLSKAPAPTAPEEPPPAPTAKKGTSPIKRTPAQEPKRDASPTKQEAAQDGKKTKEDSVNYIIFE